MPEESIVKSGYVIIDKGLNMTSQTVVTRVKRLFGADKAGHTGTLDPMATGVLPVLLGRAVKASEFMLSSTKHYVATLRLGLTSDTEDVFGTVTGTGAPIPGEAEVYAAIDSFVGEIDQIPPMVSALKVGGKKLCDLSRQGIVIERQPRKITVYSIGKSRISDTDYMLDVVCSGGTYIRTLCADIGNKLGCGGVMASLRRAGACGFSLAEAHTLEEIEAMTEEEREALIRPVETVFSSWEKIELPPFFARLARCGVEIYQKKIGTSLPLGTRVTLYESGKFFALGEVREFDAGTAIKPIRQFDV